MIWHKRSLFSGLNHLCLILYFKSLSNVAEITDLAGQLIASLGYNPVINILLNLVCLSVKANNYAFPTSEIIPFLMLGMNLNPDNNFLHNEVSHWTVTLNILRGF